MPDKRSSSAKKSTFRRVTEWLHLWLGLTSGIIVFVVCFTGGLWVFRYEVFYFTEKYQRVEVQKSPLLAPSRLVDASKKYLQKKHEQTDSLSNITLGSAGRSAICTFNLGGGEFASIFVNPYTGKILRDKREMSAAEKFFIFVRAGHRFFWLPQKIGSPLVGAGCIVFLIVLLTGLIWWFPRRWTKKTREKSFTIKWNAKWKRLNIDLHNVLGFYTLLFTAVLTITGVVFTFSWFRSGVYSALTWKAAGSNVYVDPLSDTTLTSKVFSQRPEDIMWQQAKLRHPDYGRLLMIFPQNNAGPFESMVFFGDGTLIYNRAMYYYDRYTMKPLQSANADDRPYTSVSTGEKVYRMNFDIHTGQILGLPTKIIAFIACIIGASLPVTGTLIWYNRKWGKQNEKKAYKRSINL